MLEIIAYHGWGFDRHCWGDWQGLCAAEGWGFKAFDRGYYHQPFRPVFEQGSSFKVIFAHSYGLHLCPSHQLQIADAIVIFSSFVTFHPEAERQKRRSQRVLQWMIEGFHANPQQVLEDFWAACGDGGERAGGEGGSPIGLGEPPNYLLLGEDLQDLGQSCLCADWLAYRIRSRQVKVKIFHGRGDAIVPLAQGEQLAQQLGGELGGDLQVYDGTHALPFCQGATLWPEVRSFLGDFRVR